MERTVQTKFFTFSQNNSGGYFVTNEQHGISEYVIIEAVDMASAYSRLQEIGLNVSGFDNYCTCCGERWSDWAHDENGSDEPMIWTTPLKDCKKDWYREVVYVHYFDKTFKKHELQETTIS